MSRRRVRFPEFASLHAVSSYSQCKVFIKLTLVILNRHVLRSNVDKYHARQCCAQGTQLKFSRQLAHDFALKLIETAELLAFEAHTVQADEPANQGALRGLRVVRRSLLNEFALVPGGIGFLKLHLQVSNTVRVWLDDADRAVQVVNGLQMVVLFERNHSQLVVAHARLGPDGAC